MSPEGQGVVVVVVGKRIPLLWYASSFILFCNDLPTLLLHACCLRPIAPPFPPFPPRLPFVTSPPSLSIHTSLAGLSLQGRRRGRKRKETYGRGHRISNRLCLHFQTYRQRERACGESHSTWSRHVNECPLFHDSPAPYIRRRKHDGTDSVSTPLAATPTIPASPDRGRKKPGAGAGTSIQTYIQTIHN